ncbi:MAG: hypothetical protein IJJ28_06070 [Lentisphaeria bacterium]|nr:hypothetical protein [Lentisphaeria bacterium]
MMDAIELLVRCLGGGYILLLFWLPYYLVMRGKKPCGAGEVALAVVLFAGYGAYFYFNLVLGNRDLPPEYFVNEAFMFHVERSVGLKNFNDRSQAALRGIPLPEVWTRRQSDFGRRWKYLRDSSCDPGLMFWFVVGREKPMFPLVAEVKPPDKNFGRDCVDEYPEGFCCSRWNDNIRVEVERSRWSQFFKPAARWRQVTGNVIGYLVSSLLWIFPVAALAYKVRGRWLFGCLWGLVLALYIFTIATLDRQVPAWQRTRCTPERAAAVLRAPGNREAVRQLLNGPTRVVENAASGAVIDAPLLCGGDFFPVRFLCWDLGHATYLYCSPADLSRAGIINGHVAPVKVADDLCFVRYPDISQAGNDLRLSFVIAETLAGAGWLALFAVSAVCRRRRGAPASGC